VTDDPALTGRDIQRQSEQILLQGDLLDPLAKLLVQSRDEAMVVGILTLGLHLRVVSRETEDRLKRLRMGQEWMSILQEPDVKDARRKMVHLAEDPKIQGRQLWAWYRLPQDFPPSQDGKQERVDEAWRQ